MHALPQGQVYAGEPPPPLQEVRPGGVWALLGEEVPAAQPVVQARARLRVLLRAADVGRLHEPARRRLRKQPPVGRRRRRRQQRLSGEEEEEEDTGGGSRLRPPLTPHGANQAPPPSSFQASGLDRELWGESATF